MTTVAAGLLWQAGKLLICRRREDQIHAGKWEFPGGKLEAGETPQQTLVRELREELGIRVEACEEVRRYDYAYPGQTPIRLVFFRVDRYVGSPQGIDFAELRWEFCEALPTYDFLAGDARVVRELGAGRHRNGAAAA